MTGWRYLLPAFLTVVVVAAGISLFNWFINPMGVFDGARVAGVNLVNGNMALYDRQFSAWRIVDDKPDGLILGTSRAAVGLRPDHPGWEAETVFNSAFSASSAYLNYRYFQHAMATRPLKQVVLGLDFVAFNAGLAGYSTFDESFVRVTADGRTVPDYFLVKQFQSLYSLEVAKLSLKIIRENRTPKARELALDNYKPPLSPGGMMQPDSFLQAFWKPHRDRAYSTLAGYRSNLWAPVQGMWSGAPGERKLVESYRQLLRASYEAGVDMRLFISPSQVYLYEGLDAFGLWQRWEDWKRVMVRINEEEAERAGVAAFPLWDFSGYNRFSRVTAPDEAGKDNGFEYFWDPGHYRIRLGDLILDRVLAGKRIEGFGVLLDSQMLDSHLADIRADRQSYREDFAAEVAELDEALAFIVSSADD